MAQGDPLSPMLFVLAMDVLILMIEANPNIEHVKQYDVTDGYADDITCMIVSTQASYNELITTYNSFCMTSGMIIKLQKSTATHTEDNNLRTHGAEEKREINLLGLRFNRQGQPSKGNFQDKMQKMKTTKNIWQAYSPMLKGRIIVANVLLSSIFNNYAFLPNKNLIQELKKVQSELNLYVFTGSHKMKINMAKLRRTEGGVGLVDVNNFGNN